MYETITFNSTIKNNAISLPDRYKNHFDSGDTVAVEIIITVPPSPAPKKHIAPDFFNALQIDTCTFKFNRDEANER